MQRLIVEQPETVQKLDSNADIAIGFLIILLLLSIVTAFDEGSGLGYGK